MKHKNLLIIIALQLCLLNVVLGQSATTHSTEHETARAMNMAMTITGPSTDNESQHAEMLEPGENQNDPAYKSYKEGKNLIYEEEWMEAKKKLDEMVSKYPSSEYVDDAKYWSAYALKHLDRKKAIEVYKKFIKEYPHSSYYDDAVADLSDLKEIGVTMRVDSDGSSSVHVGPGGQMIVDENGMVGGKADGSMRHLELNLRAMSRRLGRMRIAPMRGFAYSFSTDEKVDPGTRLKMEALYALGEDSEDDKSFQTLRDVALDVKQPHQLREAALDALSKFEKHDILPVYIEIVKNDTSSDMQDAAIEFISEAAKDKNRSLETLTDLFATLPKNREGQLQTVLYSIAEVGNDKAIDFLIKVARTHQNYSLRSDAVYYLGNIGGEKARAALYEILKGK